MGRIWFGLLLCSLAMVLVVTPVGCDGTNPSEQQGDGGTPTDGGEVQPETRQPPSDKPQPRSCAPQGNGCCLGATLKVKWKSHELKSNPSSDSWVGSAIHSSKLVIAVADGDDPGIRLWDSTTARKLSAYLTGHEDSVRSLAFHPSKDILASGSKDKTIRLWDTAKKTALRTLKGHGSTIYSIAFFPDGKQLVSGSEDKTVRVWNADTGAAVHEFKDSKSRVGSVTVSSDGKYIAAASADKNVYIWDVSSKMLHKTLSNGTPYAVHFFKDSSSGNEHLAVGYSDGRLRVFEMPDATQLRELQKDGGKAHNRGVIGLTAIPGKDIILSGDDEGRIRAWKISDGSFVAEDKPHSSSIRTLTSNGQHFASSSTDGSAIVHTAPNQFKSLYLAGRREHVHDVRLHANDVMYSTSWNKPEVVVWDVATKSIKARWEGHKYGITGLALSGDGKTLATASAAGLIKLWNTSEGKAIKDLNAGNVPVRGLAFSPKGDKLASASRDGKVRVWSVPGGKLEKTLDTSVDLLNLVAYSPSGKYVAASSQNGSVYVWSTSDWKQLHELKGHKGNVYALAFTSDDKLLSGGQDKAIRWWSMSSGSNTKTLSDAALSMIRMIILDEPNKQMIVAGDGRIRVWSLAEDKLLHVLFGHTTTIMTMSYDHKNKTLMSLGTDQIVRQWDFGALSYPEPIKAHDEKANTVAVSPNSQLIATGGEDNLVKIWNRRDGKLLHTLEGHTAAVTDVTFSPDSKFLASASFDKTAILWDVEKGEKVRAFEGNLDRVYRVRFSPDGTKLATAGGDWSLRTWDVKTGKQLKEMTEHKAIVTSVDWSPDGKTLLSASYDKLMFIWNADGSKNLDLPKQSVGFSDALFIVNGTQIITASFDQKVRLWSIKDKRVYRSFDAHKQSIVAIDFHPQAGIATTSFDKIVKQISTNGQVLRTFEGHQTPPKDVAFSPDASFLYSVSEGGTLRSWPLLSPERANFIPNRIGITHAAWSSDQQFLATASLDNTVKVWDLETSKAGTIYLPDDTLRLSWAKTDMKLAITIKKNGVRVVDGKTRKTIKEIKPQDKEDTFHDAAISADGTMLVTASEDTNVRVWNTESGKLSDILKGHEAPIHRVLFSPDGKLIASADQKGTVKLWSVADGTTLQSWEAHKDTIHSLAFAPDSKTLITSSADYTAKAWDLDGKMKHELCLGAQVMEVKFDSDGKRLAVGSFHGKVQIFQVSDWKLLGTFHILYSTVQSVLWSPDGSELVAAFQNGELARWEFTP